MIQQELDKLEAWLRKGNKYNLGDALVMYAAVSGGDIMGILLKLKGAGMLAWRGSRLCPTQRCVDYVGGMYMAMTDENAFKGLSEALSQRLWALYPDGVQQATGRPLRGSLGDITTRLRVLPPEYGLQGHTEDDIVRATERYLAAQGGDRRFLLTLPDFIYCVRDGIGRSRLSDYLNDDAPMPKERSFPMVTL